MVVIPYPDAIPCRFGEKDNFRLRFVLKLMNRFMVGASVLLIALTAIPVGSAIASTSRSSGVILQFHSMVGSTPGVTVRGVAAGGAPWMVAHAEVQLDGSGRLHVTIQGLLLNIPGSPLDGTTGPVTGVQASLTCEGTNVVASTGLVPLSSSGDANINQQITLPSSCVGPIVLVRLGSTTTNPGPILGAWFAATGF